LKGFARHYPGAMVGSLSAARSPSPFALSEAPAHHPARGTRRSNPVEARTNLREVVARRGALAAGSASLPNPPQFSQRPRHNRAQPRHLSALHLECGLRISPGRLVKAVWIFPGRDAAPATVAAGKTNCARQRHALSITTGIPFFRPAWLECRFCLSPCPILADSRGSAHQSRDLR